MALFQKGQSGNPNGRPVGAVSFKSLRKQLADPESGKRIADVLWDLAEHAEDEEVRRKAALDLAHYRDGEPQPAPPAVPEDAAGLGASPTPEADLEGEAPH